MKAYLVKFAPNGQNLSAKQVPHKLRSICSTESLRFILDQCCPTHSPLATCDEWPYFQTPQNKAILEKSIQKLVVFLFNLHTLNMKKCEKRWPRKKNLSKSLGILNRKDALSPYHRNVAKGLIYSPQLWRTLNYFGYRCIR